MKTEIEQRQTNRFIVLYEAYKDSNASTSVTVKIAVLNNAKICRCDLSGFLLPGFCQLS
jgi:hypothetical protein